MDKHNIFASIHDFVSKADHDVEDAADERGYDIAYDNLAMPEIRTGKAKPQHVQPAEKPEINYGTAVPEVHVKRASDSSQDNGV
ncbi:MAG: hypothetical protein IJ111_14590 [Eggerthellaceae bacterium]|nr:hypothetical protein [Eggerthellaceae bacterium]